MDPKHRKKILEYFGFDEKTRVLNINGDPDFREQEGDCEELGKEEGKVFRGLAARMNYMGMDDVDLLFGSKACSKEMARPTMGSWKKMKKVARYILGREAVVWLFKMARGWCGFQGIHG